MQIKTKPLRIRAREYINSLCIEYQSRYKRYAVIRYQPHYEVLCVHPTRQQARLYALTHLENTALQKILQLRAKYQLETFCERAVNDLAERALNAELLAAYKKPRTRKKSQKTIEKELKKATITAFDV